MQMSVRVFNSRTYDFSYGYETPPMEEGYRGIAKKTIGNATVSIARPAISLIGHGAIAAVHCVKATVDVACGALGLIATPAILAKDLTHHTYRVLNQKFAEYKQVSKETSAAEVLKS